MSYESIGALLKRLRISHGLSAHELSRLVHIRERYIIALEAGEVDALPGSAYARAYIERLLQFLEHDPNDALAAFDAATEEPHRKLFQLSMRWGNSPHPSLGFALVTAGLALLISFAYSFWKTPTIATFWDEPPVVEEEPNTPNPE